MNISLSYMKLSVVIMLRSSYIKLTVVIMLRPSYQLDSVDDHEKKEDYDDEDGDIDDDEV